MKLNNKKTKVGTYPDGVRNTLVDDPETSEITSRSLSTVSVAEFLRLVRRMQKVKTAKVEIERIEKIVIGSQISIPMSFESLFTFSSILVVVVAEIVVGKVSVDKVVVVVSTSTSLGFRLQRFKINGISLSFGGSMVILSGNGE